MIDLARIGQLYLDYKAALLPLEQAVGKYGCTLSVTATGEVMVVCRRRSLPAAEWLAIPEGEPGVERAKNDVHRKTGLPWGGYNSDPNITHDGLSTCSDDCR